MSQAAPTATGKASSSASSAKATSTSSGAPTIQTVHVGNGGFIFDPDTIYAKPGDIVTFEFYPPDHSVARAEYQKPCVPYENTGKDKVGFWSKTQYLSTGQQPTYFNVTVNDTKPVFFYCAAKGSCKDQGMVGAINPNEDQTLAVQKAWAKNSTYQIAPGDQIPSDASAALSAPPGSAPTASSTASSQINHSHALGGGAIAGIVVGAVAFLVVCAALFFYIGRTRSMKEMIKRNDATVPKNTGQENYPGSTGTPGTPMTGNFSRAYSPHMQQAEYGNLPPYGQHNVTDGNFSGWSSPAPSHATPYHLPTAQDDAKHQSHISELASPTPNQQQFTAELEAPIKSPRGQT